MLFPKSFFGPALAGLDKSTGDTFENRISSLFVARELDAPAE
jgi:hypothetical protein